MRKAGLHSVPARKPERWETPAITKQLRDILAALDELPPIDAESRGVFLRMLHRQKYFGGDPKGQIVFIIRCITESAGNEGALIGPVVRAVAGCLTPAVTDRGLEVIEAFDRIPLLEILATLRGLGIFRESSIGLYYETAVRNKLAAILAPARPATKPVATKPAPKPPRRVTRVAEVERNVEIGLQLLDLRSAIPHNCTFGRAVRRRFDIDGQLSSELMKVARAYSARPEIYQRLSWEGLLQLSSPAIPAPAREALEVRILAGERIGAPQIRRVRWKLHRPKQRVGQLDERTRMAA